MDMHPENVLYFSHVSQNEMISILSNLLKLSLKNLIGKGFDDAVTATTFEGRVFDLFSLLCPYTQQGQNN